MHGFRFLTLAPEVDERDGVLRARTSLLLLFLTLATYSRQVVVDRKSRYVLLDTRVLWFFHRKRVIPFKQIVRLTYDYESTVTSMQATTIDGVAATGDEVDSFRVGLVLRTRDDVPKTHAHLYEEQLELFEFVGDGRGSALGLNAEGQQETLSRRYVERLEALIGVGLGNELPPVLDESGQVWSCQACARPGLPRPGKCYYCGGTLAAKL
jgi:hypothetical protein